MDHPKPPIIKSRNALQTHWKKFVTLWIFPVAFIGVAFVKDFTDSNWLFAIALAIAFVLFFSVVPLVLLPYLRREISFWHVMALGAPTFAIWIVLVFFRAIVLTLLGKPL